MSQVAIWFERKFEFSFPVELHPNLSARLRGTPARLEETLRGRSHKILIKKTREKWSAQEQLRLGRRCRACQSVRSNSAQSPGGFSAPAKRSPMLRSEC